MRAGAQLRWEELTANHAELLQFLSDCGPGHVNRASYLEQLSKCRTERVRLLEQPESFRQACRLARMA